VTTVTDFPRSTCEARRRFQEMRARAITAVLLFTLSGWTQAFAFSNLDESPHDVAHSAVRPKAPGSADTRAHDCCPGVRGSVLPQVIPALPTSLPCGDSHPCCASRDSDNPPTLTATTRVERPDWRIASFDKTETSLNHGTALSRPYDPAAPQSHSRFSTVLRI
jgi:hypothetical protein